MTVWAAPRWGTICISTLQMTNAGAEEAVFHGYRKSVSCPKFSVALLQLSIWNILKIKPFGPWTTHLPLAMADSATGLAQDIHVYRAAQPFQQRVFAVLLSDQMGSRTALLYLGIYCRPRDDYSQLIQRLKDLKLFPRNNRLLFLTFTLSSCSHRSQISHISCRVLACLSTAAKFKACYHSLMLIQRYMEPQEK